MTPPPSRSKAKQRGKLRRHARTVCPLQSATSTRNETTPVRPQHSLPLAVSHAAARRSLGVRANVASERVRVCVICSCACVRRWRNKIVDDNHLRVGEHLPALLRVPWLVFYSPVLTLCLGFDTLLTHARLESGSFALRGRSPGEWDGKGGGGGEYAKLYCSTRNVLPQLFN